VEASFSEMLIPTYQTTWCHIPEDSNLYNPAFKTLKQYLGFEVFAVVFYEEYHLLGYDAV
jgi:hypothetical protein